MSPVLYRPHKGMLEDAMREVVEVNDLPQLVRHMRRRVESWYPKDELPTVETTAVKEYFHSPDNRPGMSEWKETWMVTVKGQAWGFTNGPLRESASDDVAPALVPDHRQDEEDQQDQ